MLWMLLFLFRVVICSILLSIQLFFYRFLSRHLARLASGTTYIRTLRIVFVVFSSPLIFIFLGGGWISHLPATVIASVLYPVYCWHFSWFLLFILIAIEHGLRQCRDTVRRIWRKTIPGEPDRQETRVAFEPTRRKFIKQSFIAATGTIFTATAYGAIAHNNYELSRVTIPIRGLPEDFHGFTIALLSDIHSSIFMTKETMQDYVRMTNTLEPDLIAVTGDFVNSMVEEVYPFAEAFSSLYAPYGVFGVLGNHDYYTRNVEAVASVVNECGIRLFRNEHIQIRKNTTAIILGGIDDVGNNSTAARLTEVAMGGSPENTPKIFLSHRPYYFHQFSSRNIDLTLSGHTHGGQIVLARFGNDVVAPARLASPYVAGLYSLGSSKMYVSRGIGTVAVPIRINCPPEITLITLHSTSGETDR
jgi:predicted MPP superfamily phosphohydrolase